MSAASAGSTCALVEVAEGEAVAHREGSRALGQRLLDLEEGLARPRVVSLDQVVVGQERPHARALGPDLARALERRARLLGLVLALVDLPEDHLHQALARVVGAELLEQRDRVLHLGALVRASDLHRLDEAALALRGALGQLDAPSRAAPRCRAAASPPRGSRRPSRRLGSAATIFCASSAFWPGRTGSSRCAAAARRGPASPRRTSWSTRSAPPCPRLVRRSPSRRGERRECQTRHASCHRSILLASIALDGRRLETRSRV